MVETKRAAEGAQNVGLCEDKEVRITIHIKPPRKFQMDKSAVVVEGLGHILFSCNLVSSLTVAKATRERKGVPN